MESNQASLWQFGFSSSQSLCSGSSTSISTSTSSLDDPTQDPSRKKY